MKTVSLHFISRPFIYLESLELLRRIFHLENLPNFLQNFPTPCPHRGSLPAHSRFRHEVRSKEIGKVDESREECGREDQASQEEGQAVRHDLAGVALLLHAHDPSRSTVCR